MFFEGFFPVVIVVGVVAVFAYSFVHRKKSREAFEALLARDGLMPTATPCGLDSDRLAGLRGLPRGDRRFGVLHGATGEVEVTVAGATTRSECAAFVWWWEERRTSHHNGRTTTHYDKKEQVAAAIRLPMWTSSVSIMPEGLLTRWGIGGRRDMQLESDEFNRRFDIRTKDRDLAIRLFDAQFQQFLLEMFDGRSIEITGDTLVVAGDPAGRDDLFGKIGEFAGARRDARLIVMRIPEGFWRGAEARHARDAGGGA